MWVYYQINANFESYPWILIQFIWHKTLRQVLNTSVCVCCGIFTITWTWFRICLWQWKQWKCQKGKFFAEIFMDVNLWLVVCSCLSPSVFSLPVFCCLHRW